MTEIVEGVPAPAFDMPKECGGQVSLDGLKGQCVAL